MLSADELALIGSEGSRFLVSARTDPQREVPQYPGWTLADLASHLGSIHGRTVVICRELPQERVPAPRLPDGADPIDWCELQLWEMVEALTAAEPEAKVWAFGPNYDIGFWQRRMLNETGVHRWDAQQAVEEPEAIIAEVATHSLDEFDSMYVPRLGSLPTIELAATDLGRSWVYGDGRPTVTVGGSGSDLVLRLMSRPSPVDLPEAWAEAVDALEPPPKR